IVLVLLVTQIASMVQRRREPQEAGTASGSGEGDGDGTGSPPPRAPPGRGRGGGWGGGGRRGPRPPPLERRRRLAQPQVVEPVHELTVDGVRPHEIGPVATPRRRGHEHRLPLPRAAAT